MTEGGKIRGEVRIWIALKDLLDIPPVGLSHVGRRGKYHDALIGLAVAILETDHMPLGTLGHLAHHHGEAAIIELLTMMQYLAREAIKQKQEEEQDEKDDSG